MDELGIIGSILTFLSGSAMMAAINAFINRKKASADARLVNADAEQKELDKRKNEVDYFEDVTKKLIAQMKVLETAQEEAKQTYTDEMKFVRDAQESAQKQYEQRVGTLHEKIDRLTRDLKLANDALATANETISQLRDKVEEGNTKIEGLQDKITKLLIDKAEKSKE